MDGIAGIAGYAWIFIIEGLVTIVLSVLTFFLLQDFPQTAKMLTEEERVYIIRGLREDHQFSAGRTEPFRMSIVWQTLKDPKTYVISEYVTFTMNLPLNVNESSSDHLCWLVSHLCYTLYEVIKLICSVLDQSSPSRSLRPL